MQKKTTDGAAEAEVLRWLQVFKLQVAGESRKFEPRMNTYGNV
jgi:hypothetical protein